MEHSRSGLTTGHIAGPLEPPGDRGLFCVGEPHCLTDARANLLGGEGPNPTLRSLLREGGGLLPARHLGRLSFVRNAIRQDLNGLRYRSSGLLPILKVANVEGRE